MLKFLSEKFHSKAATGNIVILLFLQTAVFLALHFQGEEIRKLSGGTGVLDLQFYYSPGKAYEMLAAYGAAGRHLYFRFIFLDMLYPVSYLFFMCLLISVITKKLFHPQSRWQKLNLLPFTVFFMDYSENLGTFVMLMNYPRRLDALSQIHSLATPLKWVFCVVNVVFILVAGFIAASRKGKKQTNVRGS